MKTFVPLIVLVLLIANSCSKICACYIPPSPQLKQLNFEVTDKDGNSIISSLKDSVSVTYIDNISNTTKTIKLTVKKLHTTLSDTTSAISAKYDGLYISDDAQLSLLSYQSPSTNFSFNLFVDNVSKGVITVNYNAYEASYPAFTPAGLSFNSLIVNNDNGITLLQTP